jgi:hypothetical protein
MATRRTSSTAQDVSEMQAAAALILKNEEMRQEKAQKRAKRRRQEERQAVQRMHRSIEVIKWCIVAICTVWVLSFIISIVVLIRVHSRVAEIELEVEGIRTEIGEKVQRIRDVLENPGATIGARLGGQIDNRIKEGLGISDTRGDEK